ncbi:hypothetical protein LPB144_07395 [Christiangramia salexigens]|uniref:Uncharacterized protein n=1 Tax=Christiangramia salexigens TaxID=1913577 RepID=A0A1L3J571_9FLAO|nr:hypothetical protein LPB144_07395 [Christiangramia salexigens]
MLEALEGNEKGLPQRERTFYFQMGAQRKNHPAQKKLSLLEALEGNEKGLPQRERNFLFSDGSPKEKYPMSHFIQILI